MKKRILGGLSMSVLEKISRILCYFGKHNNVYFTEWLPRTICCNKEITPNHVRLFPNRFKCKVGLHNLPMVKSDENEILCPDCGKLVRVSENHG